MKIQPTRDDFKKWIAVVPTTHDLVFLSKPTADPIANSSCEVLTREQVKSQGLEIWTLNLRSWYGYALNSAAYCASFSTGAIERLDHALKKEIFEEQIRFNIPTIHDGQWITSQIWSNLPEEEKINVLQRWFIQNEILIYDSIEFLNLPIAVQSELERIGYGRLLNQFPSISGPNCFAAVAGALEVGRDVFMQWMHWPELEQHPRSHGFETVVGDPKTKDVLIFEKDQTPIHAAYYLGSGLYFEKPGQDFYEPYRVAKLDEWLTAWPDSKLTLWRK